MGKNAETPQGRFLCQKIMTSDLTAKLAERIKFFFSDANFSKDEVGLRWYILNCSYDVFLSQNISIFALDHPLSIHGNVINSLYYHNMPIKLSTHTSYDIDGSIKRENITVNLHAQ